MSVQLREYLELKLTDYIPVRSVSGDIGLEIECEVDRHPTGERSPDELWIVHEDGSLRNGGVEFVLRRPIMIERLKEALVSWQAWTIGLTFMPSIRTSVHVHRNVTNKTLQEIYNIITVSWMMDNLLVRYSGKDREGNLFCLRIKDADYVTQQLIKGLEDRTFFSTTRGDEFRYASCNLTALYKFGSLEYRSMRGLSNIEEIEEWTQAIYDMTEAACQYESPKAIADFYQKKGPRDFVRSLFKKEFAEKLLMYGDVEELVDENFAYCLELSQAVKWPTLKDRYKKKQQQTDTYQEAMDAMLRVRPDLAAGPVGIPPRPQRRIRLNNVTDNASNFQWHQLVAPNDRENF